MSDKIYLGLFDVKTFLFHNHVHYDETGKNIKEGWIGIKCLWCDDSSNHLGINLSSMGISCWRCGVSGTVIKLIMRLLNIDYDTTCNIIKSYSSPIGLSQKKWVSGPILSKSRDLEGLSTAKIDLMAQFVSIHTPKWGDTFREYHRKFLISRRYNPDYVIDKYNLHCAGPVGDFARRIIIPVHYHGKIVSFVGRAARDDISLKYKNCPDNESLINIKNTLYGIDTCKKSTILVVEGIFDKWRIGDDTVATFGTKFTDEQVVLLRDFRRVFVLFDSDAQIAARDLCSKLAIFTEVVQLHLETGDPDNLTDDDVIHLRRQVFQKIL